MIRIAFGQIQIHPGDPATNFQSMMQAINYAKAVSTDILIFPELCLSGDMVGDVWDQVPFVNACLDYGDEIVKATTNTNLTIIFGNVGIDESLHNLDGSLRKYNALYVASKGELVSNPSKPYRYFNEPRYFTSANVVAKERNLSLSDINQPLTISTRQGNFTIAPVICEDSWDTHYPDCPTSLMLESAKANSQHIDLSVICSSPPNTIHKQEHRHALFSAQAKRYNTPIAYTNHVGIQNNGKNICIYDGCSTLYDVNGSIVEEVPAFENTVRPTLLKDTLWQPFSHNNTNHIEHFKNDILSTHAEINETTTTYDAHDTNGTHMANKLYIATPTYIPTLFKALQYGIRQFLAQTGIKHIVIGASGGIDSALNAALYSTVLAPENLYLVNMPSRYNSDMTKDLAYQLARNIGCHYGVFPIEEGVSATIDQLENTSFTKHNTHITPEFHHHDNEHATTMQDVKENTLSYKEDTNQTVLYNSDQTIPNYGEQRNTEGDSNSTSFLQLSTLAKENIQARDRSSRTLAGIASAVNGAFSCNGNNTEFTVGYATM